MRHLASAMLMLALCAAIACSSEDAQPNTNDTTPNNTTPNNTTPNNTTPDDDRCPAFGTPETRWEPEDEALVYATYELPDGYVFDIGQDLNGRIYRVRHKRDFLIGGQSRSISVTTNQELTASAQPLIDATLGGDNVIGPFDISGQSLMVARRPVAGSSILYTMFPVVDGEQRKLDIGVEWGSVAGCAESGQALGDLIIPTVELIAP